MSSKSKDVGTFVGLAAVICGLVGCVVGEGVNALVHTGSGTFERINKQRILERVARDWCLTIRASQVIPVYPLDEDVEVGDVYIVDTPIAKLKQYWNQRGYLPIDHRFARFQPSGYDKYYHGKGYGITTGVTPPRHWQFPTRANAAETKLPIMDMPLAPGMEDTDAQLAPRKEAADTAFLTTDWPKAPRAGFPSYGFRIKRGESLQVALPVQGIPVSMGALGARELTGSVTLSEAYTYGIDESSLRDDLKAWSAREGKYLEDYAPPENAPLADRRRPDLGPKPVNYVRVVTRVYLVRSVNVTLTNTDASVWKTSVGQPKEQSAKNMTFNGDRDEDKLLANLQSQVASHALSTEIAQTPAPTPAATPAPAAAAGATPVPSEEQKQLNAIEERIANAERREQLAVRQQAVQDRARQREFNKASFERALERTTMKDKFGGFVVPGGTLQVTSATNTTISMKETFTRPLVIGFHALEFGILEGGRLSRRPVSTFRRIDAAAEPSLEPLEFGIVDAKLKVDLKAWWDRSKKNSDFADRWLEKNGIVDDFSIFIRTPKYYGQQLALARAAGLRK